MADILWLESATSTNEVMKGMDNPPDAIVAFEQTGGRGRLGRSFSSPKGGVYASILIRGDVVSLSSVQVTARAAVAARRAIRKNSGVPTGIKWVNDLYLDGRKVCGILAQTCGWGVVVGVGVNWDTPIEEFPQELRGKAGSVFDEDRGRDEKVRFAKALVEEMNAVMEDSDWLEEYRSADILNGRRVDVVSMDRVVDSGIACGVDESASLHVMTDHGEVVLSTGEVSIAFEKDRP